MANLHAFMDRFPMVISSLFPKYFREGIESPPVWDHIAATELQAPSLVGAGDHLITARTLAGELKALVRVEPYPDRQAPLIIYHHGAKEFDTSFKGIFGVKPRLPAHLVLVRAPFHESFRRFLHGIGSLSRYLAMFAVSTCVMEEVIRQFRAAGCGPVSVTGTSLGGFVTLVHHIRFHSADRYIPLLAGPNLAHCLLESAYSRQTAKQAKAQRPYVSSRLDFTVEYGQVDHSRVYPLLGRYDQLVVPAANAAAYGTTAVALIDRGHFTGSTSFPLLRSHIAAVAMAGVESLKQGA